jgi:hypothetical protein
MTDKSKDPCKRCGRPRSWHLGQGGLGICRVEPGTSPFSEADAKTGGFVEPEDEGHEPPVA